MKKSQQRLTGLSFCRCTRHCYDCPICHANLSTTAVKSPPENSHHLRPADGEREPDSYILQCQFCEWSSLDIGVRFSKPTKITEQLNKLWKARNAPGEDADKDGLQARLQTEKLQHDAAFANLSKFYKEQLSESGEQQNLYSNSPYSSPANLQRIMSMYGGMSYHTLKKTREKPQPMREAGGQPEGLCIYSEKESSEDAEILHKMKTFGLANTTTQQQQLASPANYDARFTDELWPVATPLRVRRGKRCRTCRQFLARPEGKVGSMRYKIRLLASLHIQRLSIRHFQSTGATQHASFRLRADPLEQAKLPPFHTQQYVLTVRNPLFESVKVTLSTPGTTPGKVASKVTILCPSFTVGPAGENMWDEALSSSTMGAGSDGSRRAAMASLTGGSADSDRQPEAGKIWERSRNSTSVIIEIVPGSLRPPPSFTAKTDQQIADEILGEDDDVLEIPIHVRAEWEADPTQGQDLLAGGEKKERDSKELAYWCVLGVGRIADV